MANPIDALLDAQFVDLDKDVHGSESGTQNLDRFGWTTDEDAASAGGAETDNGGAEAAATSSDALIGDRIQAFATDGPRQDSGDTMLSPAVSAATDIGDAGKGLSGGAEMWGGIAHQLSPSSFDQDGLSIATSYGATVSQHPTISGKLDPAMDAAAPAAVNISAGMYIPSDPLLSSQWHLGNPNAFFGLLDLNVRGVWEPDSGTSYWGNGTRTVVIDDGFDYNHSDFDSYNQSLDFDYDANNNGDNGNHDLDPFGQAGDAHGTAVAGIIGANDDGTGAVGVAFDTELVGYRTHGFINDGWLQDIRDSISQAATNAQADVANISQGIANDVNSEFGVGYNAVRFDEIENSINTAVDSGRGGLGMTIVKSAGNSRSANFDVNADDWTNDTRQVVVGAVNQDGFVSSYSSYGAANLVSGFGTPGQVVTTDRVGAAGYVVGDFMPSFNGTSAAAPMVSGVVALMYDANAALGWRDVQTILASTARQVGSEIGAGTAGSERYAWGWNASETWNGGGMHYSNDYGYGLVDALAAVRLAESWLLAPGTNTAQVSGNELTNAMDMLNVATVIPDANATGLTFTGNAIWSDEVERVTVQMTFSTTFTGDLEVYVTSPDGTVSQLIADTGGGNDFNGTWTFETQAFRGERAAGQWSVRVVDDAGGDILTVSDIVVRTFGRASSSDRYVFTNEYSDYAGLDGHVTAISDTNGGTDTANASAVNSNSFLRLDGFAGRIDGVAVSFANVENAIGGDGNDIFVGSSGANALFGMRGDDLLNGLGGADAMNGGAGIDMASFVNSAARVSVNLTTGVGLGGDAHGDTYGEIENIRGSNNALADFLTGDAFSNNLEGMAGPDQIDGMGGTDTVDLSLSPDRVSVNLDTGTGLGGHAHGDVYVNIENIKGSNSSLGDFLTGDGNNNTLIGLLGPDQINGLGGFDYVDFSASPGRVNVNLNTGTGLGGHAQGDTYANVEGIIGTNSSQPDILTGNAAANVIFGGSGGDFLAGLGGADVLVGGDDVDAADYSASASRVNVNLDTATGLGGDAHGDAIVQIENLIGTNNLIGDILTGDGNANVIGGLGGGDQIDGMGGFDTVDFSTSAGRVSVNLNTGVGLGGHAHGDTYLNIENITGSDNVLADFLSGNAGSNRIDGRGGNDIIAGLGGGDLLFGGDGIDTADYSASAIRVNVNLASGLGSGGDAHGDFLSDIENLIGTDSAFGDTLSGNSGNNRINALAGSDALSGGGGNDSFVFSTTLGAGNVDHISDFDSVSDGFELDNAVFTGLAVGTLAASAFFIGAAAASAAHRIIFDQGLGRLFFDTDGNGGGAQVQFASVTAGSDMSHNDFLVI